ncbi:MAG: universal stress protein [Thermodesulfobacteriota bacterium]
MRPKPKKILIAVDGSDQSFETVRYLGPILPGDRTEVTLFHVMNWMPESFWDFASDSGVRHKVLEFGSWKSRQQAFIEDFMERARRALHQAGHPLNHVKIRVEDRRVGIARDIMRETKNGYAAVALGRHGWSPLQGLILGSIAQKIVNHTLRIPVWIVGGQPAPGKILVAMDRSEAAVRTFDCVTGHLGLRSKELLLFHVIRSLDTPGPEERPSVSQAGWSDWVDKVRREAANCEREIMQSVFERHMKRLEQTGGDVSRIKTKIRASGSSRAGSVVEEAEEGGYGTIVVGRRGHSRVEEFLMGRVSNKVLQLAKDRAVLVVD